MTESETPLLAVTSKANGVPHDLHEFVRSSQNRIEEEYRRITRRASDDPGTAGDQGEENWRELLEQWLPSSFHIVTKGRILAESGYLSPQVDVLILSPAYPQILLSNKHYLSGGVVAAFECKTTLRAGDIKRATQTSVDIRRHTRQNSGSPYRELHSSIIFGVLAHSHSWTRSGSNPVENTHRAINVSDMQFVEHPRESLDVVCVADLATWLVSKATYTGPGMIPWTEEMSRIYGAGGAASTSHVCFSRQTKGEWASNQREFYSPLGTFLSGLYSKIAWTFPELRSLDHYFRQVNMMGRGAGQMRHWPLSVYSEAIRARVQGGPLNNGMFFDEWSVGFL
jgi:Domain of unknown function (DUF6602)